MAVISHIPASESAFENGIRTFLISKIINFPDERKKKFDFYGIFSQVDGIFWHFQYIYDTPHDFLRAFQICLQNFSNSFTTNFRWGEQDILVQLVPRKYSHISIIALFKKIVKGQGGRELNYVYEGSFPGKHIHLRNEV